MSNLHLESRSQERLQRLIREVLDLSGREELPVEHVTLILSEGGIEWLYAPPTVAERGKLRDLPAEASEELRALWKGHWGGVTPSSEDEWMEDDRVRVLAEVAGILE